MPPHRCVHRPIQMLAASKVALYNRGAIYTPSDPPLLPAGH